MTQFAESDQFHMRTISPDCIPLLKVDACNSRRSEPGAPPVRVTYIIDHLHNISAGGEQALLRIIRHLPRDRFTPSVVTFKVKPRSVQILQELECPLHVFPIQRTYDWAGMKAVENSTFVGHRVPQYRSHFFRNLEHLGRPDNQA